MKSLPRYLTNCVQDFQISDEENYKILMNKTKEDLNKWRDIPCSWVGRLNIVKMSVLPTLIYRVKAFPIKMLASYFVVIDKVILKLIWRGKRPRIANTILKEKNKVEELTLLDSKTYYEATIIQMV